MLDQEKLNKVIILVQKIIPEATEKEITDFINYPSWPNLEDHREWLRREGSSEIAMYVLVGLIPTFGPVNKEEGDGQA